MSACERSDADSDSTASLVECLFDEDTDPKAYRQLKDDCTVDDLGSLENLQEEMAALLHEDAEELSPVIAVIPTINKNPHEHWEQKTNPLSSAVEATEEVELSQSLLDNIVLKKTAQSSIAIQDFVAVDEPLIIKPPSDEIVIGQKEMEPDYENSQTSLFSGYSPLVCEPSKSAPAEFESQIMLQDEDYIAVKKINNSHNPLNNPSRKGTLEPCMPAGDHVAVSNSSENPANTLSCECTRSDSLAIVDTLSNKVSIVLGSSESTPSDITTLPSRPEESASTDTSSKENDFTVVELPYEVMNMSAVDSEIAIPAISPGNTGENGERKYLEDMTKTKMQKEKYEEVTDDCTGAFAAINEDEGTSCSKMTLPPSYQEDTVAGDSNTSCSLEMLCSQDAAQQLTENYSGIGSVEVGVDPATYVNYECRYSPEVRKSSRLAEKWKDGPLRYFWSKAKQSQMETAGDYVEACNVRGQTKLHLAAMKGRLSEVTLWIQRGSNVNALDHAGWAPLHQVSVNGFLKVAQELLQAGAKVNCRGFDDVTPLHEAARCGHWKVVLCLLQNGADPQLKDARGKTAVEVCKDASVKHLLSSWIETHPICRDQENPRMGEQASRSIGDAGKEPAGPLTGSRGTERGGKSAGDVGIRQSCDVTLKDRCQDEKAIQRKSGNKRKEPSNDKQLDLVKVFTEAITEIDGIESSLQCMKSWDLSLTEKADECVQALQKMQLTLNTLLQCQKEDFHYLNSQKQQSSSKVDNELWNLLFIRKNKFMRLLKTHRELGLRSKAFLKELKQSQFQHPSSEARSSQVTPTPSAEGIMVQSSEVDQVATVIVQTEEQTTQSSLAIPYILQQPSSTPTSDFAVQRDGSLIVEEGNGCFDFVEVVYATDSLITSTQPSSGITWLETHAPCSRQAQILANDPSAATADKDVFTASTVGPLDTPLNSNVTTQFMGDHCYSQPTEQQTGDLEMFYTCIKKGDQAAPRKVTRQATGGSQADMAGGAPLLSYKALIHQGFLQPGKNVLSINVKGTVHYASLLMNGKILAPELMIYKTPMLWHKALLASKSCPRWSVTSSMLLYKGKNLPRYITKPSCGTSQQESPHDAVPDSAAPPADITTHPAQSTTIASGTQSATKPIDDVPITRHFILPSPDCDLTGYEDCEIFKMPNRVILSQNSELLPWYYLEDLFNNPDNWDFLSSEATN